MARDQQAQPIRQAIDDTLKAPTSVIQASINPVGGIENQTSFDRIVINVAKGMQQFLKTFQYFGIEPSTPDMARVAATLIVGSCETAHYPLHYPRKILTAGWLNDEVEMVTHDAEILYSELVLGLGSQDYCLKKLFQLGRTHDHELSVGPSYYVVAGSIQ